MNRRILIATMLLTTASLLARAHEGMIHVIGTVTALTEKSITVTTADKQNVGVVLTANTTYEKGTALAAWKDLKLGDRVVIHAVKVNDVLQAHDVRFSDSTVASPH